MQTNQSELVNLSIGELFLGDDAYLIPIYQRNYEWEDKQIIQLIEDIKDYYLEESSKNYYIGTLVVNVRRENQSFFYETIDGQQRLTTFNLIMCALRELKREQHDITGYDKQLKTNISFESRSISVKTIEYIYNNGTAQPNFPEFNENIINGIAIVKAQLLKLLESFSSDTKEIQLQNKSFQGFIDYLFQKVIIIRVQVPLDTDLNHYFEIMNSRGEQLEKHEILKARMMNELNGLDNSSKLRKSFHLIWDACSQMENYVQLLFPKKYRTAVFGDRWFQFIPTSSDELYRLLSNDNSDIEQVTVGLNFDEIIDTNDELSLKHKIDSFQNEEIVNESDSNQYQPVINFENFLLHVLKLMLSDSSEISLDDKRLLSFFKKALDNSADKSRFVLDFGYMLLKTKFLLDHYVLKRKYLPGEDFWTLEALKFYPKIDGIRDKESYNYINTYHEKSINDELILLLSMFHVSTPTLVYKYWLLEVLMFLHKSYDFEKNIASLENPTNIDSITYKESLIKIAKKFLKFRFLNKNQEVGYDKILLNDLENLEADFDDSLLSYGKVRNNLIFNYIDYLLWVNKKDEYKDFAFSFRSSVEHYYPQNPISGEKLEDENILNCIGNLCLISHSNNSKLSNYLPQAKKEHYINSNSKDSIKQLEMMKNSKWFVEEILEHNQYIVSLLKTNLP
ncbi:MULTISPECIES: DUF262 domain-containing protein [Sphingobacterium]|uniref:DUF262 domain-containing protein n=1 Tax=Sphingobacterium TaxID=28453 RepID=UPI002580E3D3|nr:MULTISPECIES: DUF262 domain-containing protein [Sphingobacterium]